MAVVRANVRWLGPSALVPCKAKSCDVGSSSAAGLFFQPQQIYSGQKGYSSLTCRASSGGSRRDYEKILARQKNRRVRKYFAVPSTPLQSVGNYVASKKPRIHMTNLPKF